MKFSGALIAITAASLCVARAQLTVEVILEQDQFLPAESLPAAVRIINRSGQTLKFGDQPDWLTFSVESRDGYVVNKEAEVPVLGEFTVESSQMATRRVDLAPYFTLTRPGRYQVTATVLVSEWQRLVSSKPKGFDVISGGKIWSREFGVPPAPGVTNREPEVRRYTLHQATYLKSQMRLYVSVTDVEQNRVIKLFPIGPMVSFSNPEPQLDAQSNLHLLYQTSSRAFSYTVVSPNGDLLLRQTYDYTQSRPRLTVDAKGRFSVAGGARRETPDDLPPPRTYDDVTTQKP